MDGAKLIGVHKARYYKRQDGLALGPGNLKIKNFVNIKKQVPIKINKLCFLKGAFISGLEYSTNTKAEIIGKPSKEFFLSSIGEYDLKPEECLMIGDVIIFSLKNLKFIYLNSNKILGCK